MIEKVIQIALIEVGYAVPDYHNKYAEYLDEICFYPEKVNGIVPWCGIFVDWCFVQAFGVEMAKAMLYRDKAVNAYEAYMAADKFDDVPEVGAQIFFYGDGGVVKHTGIVTNVANNIVTFISGNNLISGHSVLSRKIHKGSKRIAGYGKPNYEMAKVFHGEEPVPERGQVGIITYNGGYLTRLYPGKTVTLACAGKKTVSDIVVKCYSGPGTGTVHVTLVCDFDAEYLGGFSILNGELNDTFDYLDGSVEFDADVGSLFFIACLEWHGILAFEGDDYTAKIFNLTEGIISDTANATLYIDPYATTAGDDIILYLYLA